MTMAIDELFPQEGGCVCGAVRYRLTAPPKAVYACHCKDCQRMSNSTHTISMLVAEGDMTHLQGELAVYEKPADSGNVVKMLSCARCGTKMWNVPATPGFLIMKAGNLDDISWAKPVGNIWVSSKAPWVEISANEPQFEGQPTSREALIDAWRVANGLI